MYAASLNFVHEQYFDAHLVDQGIVDTFMRIWPGRFNVVCSVDLYSLTAGLVVVSLAECLYSNPYG